MLKKYVLAASLVIVGSTYAQAQRGGRDSIDVIRDDGRGGRDGRDGRGGRDDRDGRGGRDDRDGRGGRDDRDGRGPGGGHGGGHGPGGPGGGHGGYRRGWYTAVNEDCNVACQRIRLRVGFSSDGAQCASGEVLPLSAQQAGIRQPYGCWGTGCYGLTTQNYGAASVGRFCYIPRQKRDNDRTDVTVGCYCQ